MNFVDFVYLVNYIVLAVLVDFVNFTDLAGLVNLLDLPDFGAFVFSSCEETGCPLLLLTEYLLPVNSRTAFSLPAQNS